MTVWVRFEGGFGTVSGSDVVPHAGDMFGASEPSGPAIPLADLTFLAPVVPGKFICLWNNFHALAAKLGQAVPQTPLYLLKPSSAILAPGGTIRPPVGYAGKTTYEGELGIVIGRRCSRVNEADAAQAIFGYTCVNDVTALDLLHEDPSFAQWTRAKGCDTFGPVGPAIATGLDPMALTVRTVLNGRERQNYPMSDMILSPASVVSLLSREMTLLPGDLIACGTSLGVLPCAGAAHLGHHVAAEDRAADAANLAPRRATSRARWRSRRRPRPEHHAAVPHPRPDRRRAGAARRRARSSARRASTR
jgi:2-keto-4-pentenoate hydratase/2-oxohepta-3-ene-1,7-dioic acid hydratase in catechol pathway